MEKQSKVLCTIGPVPLQAVAVVMSQCEQQGWQTVQVLFVGMQEVKRLMLPGQAGAEPLYAVIAGKAGASREEAPKIVFNTPK